MRIIINAHRQTYTEHLHVLTVRLADMNRPLLVALQHGSFFAHQKVRGLEKFKVARGHARDLMKPDPLQTTPKLI